MFCGLFVLNINNSSTFWILFNGLITSFFSMNKLSTVCFSKDFSSSIYDISILSILSYIFWGFFVLNKDIFSMFWILFSGFFWIFFSMNNASINCICKGSFWAGNISKEWPDSIEFCSLFNSCIVILSTFCIKLSGLIKNDFSINKSSTTCFFKGSFSIGRISKLSLASAIVFSFENIEERFLELLKINKLSIICFSKGRFSIGRISKLSFVSIEEFWFNDIFLWLLINKLSTNCLLISFLSKDFLFCMLFNLLLKSFNSFSFCAKDILSFFISSS